jgi:hypothetical protein
MTLHGIRLHRRRLLSTLACLSLFAPPLLRAQQPAAAAVDVENRHAEILRKAASSKPADRISAAEAMAYQGMDYDLFWKLMNDPDPEVRLNVFFTLDSFCSGEHPELPLERVRKMAALLEQEVTDARIQAAFEDKDSKKAEDAGINLLYACALCLNRLYQTTPLQDNPQGYNHWQERVLKYLVICLADDRDAHGDAHEEYLYEMLAQITDPAVLKQALESVLERLDDLPAERQLTALEELWAHPLLGAGKPMNLLLLQELSPAWAPVRAHILRNIRYENRRKETTDLLSHIDEAFVQVRSQLAPPP